MSIKELSGNNTLSIGMKVKMNIPVIEAGDLDGIEFTASGKNYLLYMQQHPEEVYTVTDIKDYKDCPYVLSGFMKDNSWAANELIVVPDPKSNFEVIKNMTQEEMASQLPPMLQSFFQDGKYSEKDFANFLSAAPITDSTVQPVITGFWQKTTLENPKFSLEQICFERHPWKIDLDYFLHGVCTIFSLELHKRFGYPIFCCYDHFRWEQYSNMPDVNPESQLLHSFCMDAEKKLYIDVRGIVNDEQAFLLEFKDCFTEIFIREITDVPSFEQQIKELMTDEEYNTLTEVAQYWISSHQEFYVC